MNPRQWFAKGAEGNLGAMIDKAVGDMAVAKFRELAKASVPGVGGVAGPNMLLEQLGISFVTTAGYVGTQVFGTVQSDQIGGTYARWGLDALKDARLRPMGDGRAPDELDDKVEFPNFTCSVYGGRRSIGLLTRANAAGRLDLMGQASGFLLNAALQHIDDAFVEAYWAVGKWQRSAAVAAAWDTSGSTPAKDIHAALESLSKVWPNMMDTVLVLPLEAFNALARHQDFRGQGAAEQPLATVGRIMSVTGVGRVVVGRAGKTKTTGFLGKNAAVFVAPQNQGMNDPSAGARVIWAGVAGNATDGIATRVMADPLNHRTVVDTWIAQAFVQQSDELGYFLTNVVS